MRRLLVVAVATASLIVVIAAPIVAGDGGRRFESKLSGFNETPQTLSVPGSGTFTARLARDGQSLAIKLTYRNLTSATGPTQAHIHFGAPATSGGIVVWLCGSATNPGPAGTAVCPASASGTVELTVGPANVVGPNAGPPGQGILAGEWEEVVRAMRAGVTYANVHTPTFGGGEIRGRITRSDND